MLERDRVERRILDWVHEEVQRKRQFCGHGHDDLVGDAGPVEVAGGDRMKIAAGGTDVADAALVGEAIVHARTRLMSSPY